MLPPKTMIQYPTNLLPTSTPYNQHNHPHQQIQQSMTSTDVTIEESSPLSLDSTSTVNTTVSGGSSSNNSHNVNNAGDNNDSNNNNNDNITTTNCTVNVASSTNLNEDSMMILSQSIDSIHTIGTNNGTDGLERQVRTLFVSGLPLDAKPRELYLLFRSFKGYLSSTLKPPGKNGKLTAPVGFVTFESREQAEEALSKLQGVKFDPDGNQHMRLEFAHSNTKVTKPKANLTPGFNQIANMNTTHLSINSLSQHQATTNLPSCYNNSPAGTNLSGLMNNLQSSLLNQLSTNAGNNNNNNNNNNINNTNTHSNNSTNTNITTAFDPANGVFNSGAEAMAAAAAAAAIQWASIPALPSICTGYDNTAYLTSAASLLQANNFRTLLPGNMNPGGFNMPTANGTTVPSLQMVQAALAQANVAAAFAPNNAITVPAATPISNTSTSGPFTGAHHNTTGSTNNSSNTSITTTTNNNNNNNNNSNNINNNSANNELTAMRNCSTSNNSHIHPNRLNNYHFNGAQQTLTDINSFVTNIQHHQQQQQQQQQALTKMQLNQHINSNPSVAPLGYSNVVTVTAATLPPQMTAAAIGLLGGYNSIIKELTGSDSHMQTGLPPQYQTNVNY